MTKVLDLDKLPCVFCGRPRKHLRSTENFHVYEICVCLFRPGGSDDTSQQETTSK